MIPTNKTTTTKTGGFTITIDELHKEDLSSTQRELYVRVLSLSRINGYCYASTKALACMVGFSQRTVFNALEALEQKGFIVKINTYQHGKNGGLIYSNLHIYPVMHLGRYFDLWHFSQEQRERYISKSIKAMSSTFDKWEKDLHEKVDAKREQIEKAIQTIKTALLANLVLEAYPEAG